MASSKNRAAVEDIIPTASPDTVDSEDTIISLRQAAGNNGAVIIKIPFTIAWKTYRN